MIENKIKKTNKLLPSHYYINENGLLVFTEEYHLNRGYCCGSGCKHCPFEPVSQKGNTIQKNNNT